MPNDRVRLKPAPRRPTHHHPRCTCPTCQPRLDFDGRRAAEKTENERLRAEVDRLRLENTNLKETAKKDKAAEKEAAERELAAMQERSAVRLRELKQAAERAAGDQRTQRLLGLRARGYTLRAAIEVVERENDENDATTD